MHAQVGHTHTHARVPTTEPLMNVGVDGSLSECTCLLAATLAVTAVPCTYVDGLILLHCGLMSGCCSEVIQVPICASTQHTQHICVPVRGSKILHSQCCPSACFDGPKQALNDNA